MTWRDLSKQWTNCYSRRDALTTFLLSLKRKKKIFFFLNFSFDDVYLHVYINWLIVCGQTAQYHHRLVLISVSQYCWMAHFRWLLVCRSVQDKKKMKFWWWLMARANAWPREAMQNNAHCTEINYWSIKRSIINQSKLLLIFFFCRVKLCVHILSRKLKELNESDLIVTIIRLMPFLPSLSSSRLPSSCLHGLWDSGKIKVHQMGIKVPFYCITCAPVKWR